MQWWMPDPNERMRGSSRSSTRRSGRPSLSSVLGADFPQADHIELHSWRYVNIGSQQGDKALIDAPNRLAAIGDWCIKGRVESAFLSAMQAARELQPML